MGLRLVADKLITWVEEAFSGPGVDSIRLLDARAIDTASLRDADVLLVRSKTRIDRSLLEGTSVRFVGSATVGVDHVDESAMRDLGITFVAAPGSSAATVCQFTMAAIVATASRLGLPWRGRTLGVVGCGAIGERVARSAEALGLGVLRIDPPLVERNPGDRRYSDPRAIADADIVTLHLPLEDEGPHPTRSLVDRSFLERLKPSCFLVNTSRGDVVDETALVQALVDRRLAGAALDVFAGEPSCHPETLRHATLLTPHVAGRSLEGMTGNTLAVLEAFARHFGLVRSFDPRPHLPPAPTLSVPAEADLAAVIETNWTLGAVDAALRGAANLDGSDRIRAFDRARVAGALRRDLSAYVLPAGTPGEVRSFIRALPRSGLESSEISAV